jgi:hypothetical protein
MDLAAVEVRDRIDRVHNALPTTGAGHHRFQSGDIRCCG